jgi:hypothetical protein
MFPLSPLFAGGSAATSPEPLKRVRFHSIFALKKQFETESVLGQAVMGLC